MQAPSHTADAPPQERPGFGFVISKARRIGGSTVIDSLAPIGSQVDRMVRGMRGNHHGLAFA